MYVEIFEVKKPFNCNFFCVIFEFFRLFHKSCYIQFLQLKPIFTAKILISVSVCALFYCFLNSVYLLWLLSFLQPTI